jgi:RNA polymerase sigma factor (sigma-70 family)
VLRAVAKDRSPQAWALYQQGDAAYWHVVQAHEGFVRQQAYRHARASQVDIDTVVSALREAAFDSAVNWDPEKASYTTASVLRMASSWQRANERQSAVVAGDTRELRATTGGFAKVDVSSLDETVHDSDNRLLDLIESLDPDALDYLVAHSDRKALEAACAALSARALDVFRRRQSGETLEEVGTALGVSKERARQIGDDAVKALRLAMQRSTR